MLTVMEDGKVNNIPSSLYVSVETAYLPLPRANINSYFSLRAKCWLREGVGSSETRLSSGRMALVGSVACTFRLFLVLVIRSLNTS